jgi:hypothetical protein
MLPKNAATLLAQTFSEILGPPESGSMAFTRAFPLGVTEEFAANLEFSIKGWEVAAVLEYKDEQKRWITADEAVEIRENKQKPILLLIPSDFSGAGTDGIYSAAREIAEKELFDKANSLTLQKLSPNFRAFAKKALKKAKGLSRERMLSPWSEFLYLCRTQLDQREIGGALPLIGLWPIFFDNFEDKPDEKDIDKSCQITERILPLLNATRQSPEQKVSSLKLTQDGLEIQNQLSLFLREMGGKSRLDALKEIEARPEFWLNKLNVGLFEERDIEKISIVSWRSTKGKKPPASSGLVDNNGQLELRLNRNSEDVRVRPRLEIKWNVEPENLEKGSIEYLVQIRSGQDVLSEKLVGHNGKSLQKVSFSQEDFEDIEDIEENARFESQISVSTSGKSDLEDLSEPFLICHGETVKTTKSSSSKKFSTLSLAAAFVANDIDAFKKLAQKPDEQSFFTAIEKGYISCRYENKSSQVFCPPLLSELGKIWVEHKGALCRWRLRVRPDGTHSGDYEYIDLSGVSAKERFVKASRQFAGYLDKSHGPLGIIYHPEIETINEYILSAMDCWQSSSPALSLIQTLEVVSFAGDCIGLIVLPTHPLRVAWQQAFDSLVLHHRYQENLSALKLQELLEKSTGTNYPAFLPGISEKRTFVFADNLSFHAVALVLDNDPEPKASVALLARLIGGNEIISSTVGNGTSESLAEEIKKYLHLHPDYNKINVHALRSGDSMPVVRALGKAIPIAKDDEQPPEATSDDDKLCYELNLFSAKKENALLSGRFLSTTAERRRKGVGLISEVDNWIFDDVTRSGGNSLPRLRWSKRETEVPITAAHLSIAFDVFSSKVEFRSLKDLENGGIVEAHGLMIFPTRKFETRPNPNWISYVPINAEGEKHPFSSILTKRLLFLHEQILRSTAVNLGGTSEISWPVLVTNVTKEQSDLLESLHQLCDWVITADSNAGIEYFDSPKELPNIYNSFVIDCVPQQDDLGFIQLITSTSSFDEIVNLFEKILSEMKLSASPDNCLSLLNSLKALSGRLALKLAGHDNTAQEMIALALVHNHCKNSSKDSEYWMSLSDGYFVPLDDLPELFGASKQYSDDPGERADLIYVTAGRKSGLRLSFVEVKFRRFLKTARSNEVSELMQKQIDSTCKRWDRLFGPKTNSLEKTLNLVSFSRILRFYANKGRRYSLTEQAYKNIAREIDRLVRRDSEPPQIEDIEQRGYIFCPEYKNQKPEQIEHNGQSNFLLFGHNELPELSFQGNIVTLTSESFNEQDKFNNTYNSLTVEPVESNISALSVDNNSIFLEQTKSDKEDQFLENKVIILESVESELPTQFADENAFFTEPNQPIVIEPFKDDSSISEILLGHEMLNREPVLWSPRIDGNPHLMILGIPGMGKTTCLVNICQQLQAQDITPIVFSYHEDLDEKLTKRLNTTPKLVRYAGLGFNPMDISKNDSAQVYLDNAGMLRDIFAAIFPDLGDIQLGKIREALKTSYQKEGWGYEEKGEVPRFRFFLDLLRKEPKPDMGILTRLNELDDYGFFNTKDEVGNSLLDGKLPILIQIHAARNEALQRAFATFIFYNLYQNMFLRGVQKRITHAIIFDEAHRAAKLKLIPAMVKECRKYGIAFVMASQEAKDFDSSLFGAIGGFLALKLNETDAKTIAKIFAPSDKIIYFADRIKQMDPYHAMYYGGGKRLPVITKLYSG